MPFSRRELLTLALTAAVPGLPVAVCAQLPDDPSRAKVSSETLPYSALPEVQEYILETTLRTQLPHDFIAGVLDQASYSRRAERLMTPKPRDPSAPKPRGNWLAYKNRMVERTRIGAGLDFLEENERYFGMAEDRYGVPRDIVAGIIGIETLYGRNQGHFRVLDVLCTLSFDYKRRAEYFRSELTEFLLLIREQNLEPTSVLGSFAGAIGLGQFMPSSIRKLAVDFDGDGKIDLTNSAGDAIGSVANYLADRGWMRGMPSYFNCSATKDADLSIAGGGIRPTHTLREVLRAGFVPDFELELPEDEPEL